MRTFTEWCDLARGHVRTSEDKIREIGALCWLEEMSGGVASVWHGSAVVHGHVCNCASCKHHGETGHETISGPAPIDPRKATLFYRDGRAFTGKPHHDDKGRPFTTEPKICHRCGGMGGSDKWAHTGWTCYECGGKCTLGTRTIKLYGADKIDSLNRAANTRATKKAAKAEAERVAREIEAESRRSAFRKLHGALIEKARPYAPRSEFVADVLRKAEEKAMLTEGQEVALRNAIERFEASDAKKAGSEYIGTVGKRVELTVTAERVVRFHTHFGTSYIVTMRDESGNAIVSKGRYFPPGANYNDDRGRYDVDSTPFRIRGTIKEHSTYNGERQTVLQRVADVEKKNRSCDPAPLRF